MLHNLSVPHFLRCKIGKMITWRYLSQRVVVKIEWEIDIMCLEQYLADSNVSIYIIIYKIVLNCYLQKCISHLEISLNIFWNIIFTIYKGECFIK